MLKKCVRVELPSGLEARPAAMLVQTASQYESRIYLESDGKRVNAKSIMGMMSLALVDGEKITDVRFQVEKSSLEGDGRMLKRGKKKFKKICVK